MASIIKDIEVVDINPHLRIFITNIAHQELAKNYFTFNNQIYHKIQCIALGTRMVPNYAIIFMGYLETTMLHTYPKKPYLWKRFTDDIFFIWKHGETELKLFLDFLNNFHPTIKFTMKYNLKEIPFLDCIVYKNGNRLCTRLKGKPTDNKQYLNFNSCHPRKQKESVPCGLLIRC